MRNSDPEYISSIPDGRAVLEHRMERAIAFPFRSPGPSLKLVEMARSIPVETEQLEVMNLKIPKQVPGVDSKYLNPAKTWGNPDNYWKEATRLARLFDDNIRHHGVPEQILWAGPRVRQQILD